MEKNNEIFNETVGSLFKGMDSFLSTKTVVGEAIHIGDTIILPLVDVTFGVAAVRFPQHGFQKEQQRRRYGRKDASQRGSDHSQWHNPHDQRGQQPRYREDPGYDSGFRGQVRGGHERQEPGWGSPGERQTQEMEDMIDDAVNPQ